MSSSAESHEPFTLRVCPEGFVRLSWPPDAQVTGPLARAAVAAVNELNAGRERGLLVDMTGTAVLTREARNVFAQKNSVSAMALVGRSAVDRVIVNFALGVNPMSMPSRFFTSESLAIEWLRDVDTRA